MPGLLPNIDPDGLLEYSVVYTDRALNHMSNRFRGVMVGIGDVLKQVYNAPVAVIIPGSGTFGMEAVARQFAHNETCLVIRNGWFSYRWSQIFDMGKIPSREIVLKAKPISAERQAPWAPADINAVVNTIRREKPALVFAPHVETSSGMILPDDYLRAVGQAVREVGGLFVLDCIASGAIWVNMKACQVDVLISAPQKGWSGSPGCAFVLLNDRAREKIDATQSSSFACDLRKWLQIMEAFEKGGHAYHTTMPTDGLVRTQEVMLETQGYGFDKLRDEQWALGTQVRSMMKDLGFASVAAEGFQAPGVVVSYTDSADLATGKATAALGLQTAAGVPLQCDEPADFRTFRIGLFGLEKWHNPTRSVETLRAALSQLR